jgi:hypothetical protein
VLRILDDPAAVTVWLMFVTAVAAVMADQPMIVVAGWVAGGARPLLLRWLRRR